LSAALSAGPSAQAGDAIDKTKAVKNQADFIDSAFARVFTNEKLVANVAGPFANTFLNPYGGSVTNGRCRIDENHTNGRSNALSAASLTAALLPGYTQSTSNTACVFTAQSLRRKEGSP
jgi:hypothetical protein